MQDKIKIDLITQTKTYVQFMSNVGELSTDKLYINDLPKIFEENVSKIENGKLILQGHKGLSDQLINARNFAFPWEIKILDIVCDKEKNTSAVRFTWNSKKVGAHITTAILKFNTDGKILEVNEVYNRLGDLTH